MALELENDQKETILMRFTNIMDKVKHKYGIFFFFHTCTKSFLIVGSILIPSILSIEAMFYDNKEVRMIVFWGVWALSLIIAVISSFVNFFNTPKKYNLYNQFSTMIQREVFSYIGLTGPYKILSEHLDLLKSKKNEIRSDAAAFSNELFVLDQEESSEEYDGYETKLTESKPSANSSAAIEEEDRSDGESNTERKNSITQDASSEVQFRVPDDLFLDNEVTKYSVDDVPYIIRKGHMFHYSLFLERLESLYRRLTNSNIDMNYDDMSNPSTVKNTLADKQKQQEQNR